MGIREAFPGTVGQWAVMLETSRVVMFRPYVFYLVRPGRLVPRVVPYVSWPIQYEQVCPLL